MWSWKMLSTLWEIVTTWFSPASKESWGCSASCRVVSSLCQCSWEQNLAIYPYMTRRTGWAAEYNFDFWAERVGALAIANATFKWIKSRCLNLYKIYVTKSGPAPNPPVQTLWALGSLKCGSRSSAAWDHLRLLVKTMILREGPINSDQSLHLTTASSVC